MVEQLHIELLDLGEVEMGGRAAEGRQVEALGQLGEAGLGLDRLRRAETGEQRIERHRLDPGVAQGIDPGRAEPLGELSLRRDQQRLVREAGRGRPQRGEHL